MTLGEVGMLLVIIGSLPYILLVIRGRVHPERSSWFVWTVILALALWGYRNGGAGDSLWFLLGDFIASAAIFLLSIWKGRGGWTRLDLGCLAIAGLSLAFWQLSNISLFVLWGVLIADAVAAVPTFLKSLRAPHSESASAFIFSSAGALCGFIAVGQWNFGLLFYPAYLFLVNLIIALTIWVGQYQVNRVQRVVSAQ